MFFNRNKKNQVQELISVSDKRDKKIWLELGHKNKEAFMEAYDLYADSIYRFVYFKVGDSEEAKDLTSAVFLKVWNHIREKGIKDYKTLKSLLYAVARNAIIDYYRKNSGIAKNVSTDDESSQELPAAGTNPEEMMDVKMGHELVMKKLYELKDEYREIIVLKYVEELSVTEISRITGKSKGNIRVLLHRSLKALKDLMGTE